MKKIAFLDRDGVLINEPQDDFQIDSLEKLIILPNVKNELRKLIKSGYELVMVSNQNGIGTPSFPQEDFDIPQNEFERILKENGIEFNEIFVCPHLPEENCSCRKPKTGLVDEYLKNTEIDYEKSFMVGDRETDMQFAKNVGIKGYLKGVNYPFPRIGMIERKTKETDIFVQCNLDGQGKYQIDTGIKFFDHMLEQLSKHSLIDITIKCNGDLKVDEHHTIEDVGIALGEALSEALGERKGIKRYGFLLPMDEALIEVALDLGGRSNLIFNGDFKREFVGDMPTEMVKEFFKALSDKLKSTIHINVKYGDNEHHKIEGIFKAIAKSLQLACKQDKRIKEELPSTKELI